MRLNEVINAAKDQLQSILTLDVANVIAASKTNDGWDVKIDLVERKAIPDTQDLLGTYDVILDEEGNIVSYERKRIRKRMDLEVTIE